MKLIKRIKNLWKLSLYRVDILPDFSDKILVLKKDIPTIKKKIATIVKPDREDIFKQPDDYDNPSE